MIGSTTGDVTMAAGLPSATMPSAADAGVLGKEDFLKLLVAQLTQQDPLNPQDGAEFVAQLAQFSSVEQLVNIRGGLDTLAMAQQASTSAQVVGFIGRDVVALGDTVQVGANGGAMTFSLGGDAATVDVDVLDKEGNVVATVAAGACGGGESTVLFDGLAPDGTPLAEGEYRYEVRAKDADGAPVNATTFTTGTVAGVTFESGYPELMLTNGRRLALADVVRVEREGERAGLPGVSWQDEPAGVDPDAGVAKPGDEAAAAETRGGGAVDVAAEDLQRPVGEAPTFTDLEPGGGRTEPRFSGPDLQGYLQRMMQRGAR